MFLEQQGAAGDPVIAANPEWWEFFVPQVIVQRRMNDWTQDQTTLYVAKQLESQIPEEKRKQIPALTVEVLKRVRQADAAAETPSTVDLSTIGEFRSTKAAVEIGKL